MTERLAGKVAVITGASSGIGEATAMRFVEEGARVVIADIQVESGTAVADRLGDAARFIECDVTIESRVADAVDLAVATWGRLDCMFNNAGVIGAVGPLVDTTAEAWNRTIGRAAELRLLRRQARRSGDDACTDSGVILSTSSVAGLVAGLGPHAYTVAKTGILALTRSAAIELGPHGIRVNAIAPGTIPTAMTALAITGDAAAVDAGCGARAQHEHARYRQRADRRRQRCALPGQRRSPIHHGAHTRGRCR